MALTAGRSAGVALVTPRRHLELARRTCDAGARAGARLVTTHSAALATRLATLILVTAARAIVAASGASAGQVLAGTAQCAHFRVAASGLVRARCACDADTVRRASRGALLALPGTASGQRGARTVVEVTRSDGLELVGRVTGGVGAAFAIMVRACCLCLPLARTARRVHSTLAVRRSSRRVSFPLHARAHSVVGALAIAIIGGRL